MFIKSESFCDDSQHTNSAVFNSSSWHITSHNTCRQTSTQPLPLLAAEQVKSSWCSQHWARLYEELREVSKTPGSTTLEYYMVIISMLTLTPWLLNSIWQPHYPSFKLSIRKWLVVIANNNNKMAKVTLKLSSKLVNLTE